MRRRTITACLFACFVVLAVGGAQAEEMRRFGLFVGDNDGGPGTHRLLYAAEDARRMHEVMTTHGAIDKDDARLLVDVTDRRLLDAIRAMGKKIRAHRSTGRRAALFFYYSGHGGPDGLMLGPTHLDLRALKQALQDTSADLRVIMLDACQSGRATRAKGGHRAPSFLVEVDRGDNLTGEVVITSSAGDEASQESDRVGGGYFTHHLITGLRGAADTSRDGMVTLDEAYAYAYHRTLYETAGTAAGLQHPGYAAELRGHGTLVLTWPLDGETILVFPAGLDGSFLVFDRDRKLFVADLALNGHEERRLALPAGRYVVQKRQPDRLLTTEVHLTRGVMRRVDERDMVVTGFEQDFAKGVERANVRRATRVPVLVSGLAGAQHFMLQPSGPPLFVDMPMVGLEFEWRGLLAPAWSLSADFMSGTAAAVLDFPAYDVAASYWQFNVGLALKYGRTWGRFHVAVGPHLGNLYVRRAFPGGTTPTQDFMMVAPGAIAQVAFRMTQRTALGAQARGHLLYYYVDDDDFSLAYREALIRLTIRF